MTPPTHPVSEGCSMDMDSQSLPSPTSVPSPGGEGECAGALDDRDRATFIAQGLKQRAARLAGEPFTDWLLALAKIAEPEDPAAWLVGSVVLNEECWFDYFDDGYTPADCWAEECSYD